MLSFPFPAAALSCSYPRISPWPFPGPVSSVQSRVERGFFLCLSLCLASSYCTLACLLALNTYAPKTLKPCPFSRKSLPPFGLLLSSSISLPSARSSGTARVAPALFPPLASLFYIPYPCRPLACLPLHSGREETCACGSSPLSLLSCFVAELCSKERGEKLSHGVQVQRGGRGERPRAQPWPPRLLRKAFRPSRFGTGGAKWWRRFCSPGQRKQWLQGKARSCSGCGVAAGAVVPEEHRLLQIVAAAITEWQKQRGHGYGRC